MSAGGIFIVLASFGIYLEKDSDRRFLFNTFGKYISPVLIEDIGRVEECVLNPPQEWDGVHVLASK